MKRASYREGIEIIALNDDPMEIDIERVQSQISVQLLAALFDKEATDVAKAVIKYRKKTEKHQKPTPALDY